MCKGGRNVRCTNQMFMSSSGLNHGTCGAEAKVQRPESECRSTVSVFFACMHAALWLELRN